MFLGLLCWFGVDVDFGWGSRVAIERFGMARWAQRRAMVSGAARGGDIWSILPDVNNGNEPPQGKRA